MSEAASLELLIRSTMWLRITSAMKLHTVRRRKNHKHHVAEALDCHKSITSAIVPPIAGFTMLYSINITMMAVAAASKVRLMNCANFCLFFAGFEKLYIAVDTGLDVADTIAQRTVTSGS